MWKSGESGNKKGRPKGSKNKRSLINESLQKEAMAKLSDAVSSGEAWAIQAVLDRTMPKLKQITPDNSLDGEYLAAKIKEVAEFEARLAALEAKHNESDH